jgi:hypothetical protein
MCSSLNPRNKPKLNPLGSGPQGPNSGSNRVRLTLRLRSSSDFSVPSFLGRIQSTVIDKKKETIIQKQLCSNSSYIVKT